MNNRVSKKIKLLIIVKSIDGGTGTFLFNFLKIKKIFQRGEVNIKTLVLERPTYRNVGRFNPEYFRSKNFYPQKYSLSPFNFISFFDELLWVKRKLGKYKSTAILSVDLRCNLLAIIAKMLFFNNIKIIATNHINLGRTIFDKSTPAIHFILRWAIRHFYNQADVLVCVSKELSINLKRDFNLNQQIITVYNGVKIKLDKTRRSFKKGGKVIITIARLVEQKDHMNLIKAFDLLQRKLPNTELWILSDGPKRKEIETSVNRLKLDKKIKLLGWVKTNIPYLKRSDVFVLSSKREGFAYVLVEAMSQGIPVVSTNTPYGPSEVLDNGKYGLLVPMDDPVSMKNAILKILTDKEKSEYYSKKSLERSKYFSEEKMLTNYKKIIRNLAQ